MSYRERLGLYIIYPTGILLILVTGFYEHNRLSSDDRRTFRVAVREFREEVKKVPLVSLAPFDPDTVSAKSLARYGLPQPVIRSWTAYRKKAGGTISTVQIRKLYSMTDSIFDAISPYIVKKQMLTVRKVALQRENLDINLADTLLWRSLRGIGPVLSRRVVAYRDILGGFVHTSQLLEVYGIDSTLYHTLRPRLYVSENFEPVRINLWQESYARLRAHPYISSKQASAIIHFRAQHDPPDKLEELYQLQLFDSLTVQRLSPYISTGTGEIHP